MKNKLTRLGNKALMKAKKHSPELLMFAGIVGAVGSAVIACKATLKVNDILEENQETIEKIRDTKELIDNGELDVEESYTDEDMKKDITVSYIQTGLKIAKNYAPAIMLGVASITSIIAGHKILTKRNVALAAAYTAVDKGYKEYRQRVIDKFGDTVDKELKYDMKVDKIKEKIIDEKGKEKEIEKTVNTVGDVSRISPYARFFDESNPNFDDSDNAYNLMFLKGKEDWANDVLKSRGYLYLNEVYDSLGIKQDPIAQVCGWIYDEKNPTSDNYVDFGIFDAHKPVNRDFVNGYEPVILLDFNVQGNIWEILYKKG